MEEKRIDYEQIAAGRSPEHKMRMAQDQIKKVGYVSLSDALANRDRDSVIVLQALDAMCAEDRLPRYKIKILRDAYGYAPEPGDVHEWKWQIKTRDEFGKKYDQSRIHEMVRRGEDTHVIYHSAVIDEDGCITVGYKDAVMLLNNYGVHWFSHMPISKMRELSREPVSTEKGQRHIHNWRYMEIPPWLDVADAETTATKKRGRPKKVVVEA
jgi:hypothetical protein